MLRLLRRVIFVAPWWRWFHFYLSQRTNPGRVAVWLQLMIAWAWSLSPSCKNSGSKTRFLHFFMPSKVRPFFGDFLCLEGRVYNLEIWCGDPCEKCLYSNQMVLRKKTIDAYFCLSQLFHHILRFCVQEQNGGKRAKIGHISDHCSDSNLHHFGSKDGKQMKGKYPPFVTAVKHSSWKLETILTWLLWPCCDTNSVVEYFAGDDENTIITPQSHWGGSGSSLWWSVRSFKGLPHFPTELLLYLTISFCTLLSHYFFCHRTTPEATWVSVLKLALVENEVEKFKERFKYINRRCFSPCITHPNLNALFSNLPHHPSHMLSGRLTSIPSRETVKRIDLIFLELEEKPRK